MEIRRCMIFVINVLIYSGRIDYAFLHNVEEGTSTESQPVRHRSTHGHAKGKTNINDDSDLHKAMARNKEMKEQLSDLWLPSVHKIWKYWHKSGARKVMGAIASKLIQHAGDHISRHIGRVIRSTVLNKDLTAPVSFVNSPPIGPMETLSIDVKGNAQTYKNFSKPLSDDDTYRVRNALTFGKSPVNNQLGVSSLEQLYLQGVGTGQMNVSSSTESGDDDGSSESGDGFTGSTERAQNKTRRKKKKPALDGVLKVPTKARPMSDSASSGPSVAVANHVAKKKKKHWKNKYKVYSEAMSTNSSMLKPAKDDRYNATGYLNGPLQFTNESMKLSFPQWVELYSKDGARNKSSIQGVSHEQSDKHLPGVTVGHNNVVEVPHSNLAADPLSATHAGDVGIHQHGPQEALEKGHEQGPLLPGSEQGPKLPGHEKGPLLKGHSRPGEEQGPLLPGQSHVGNLTSHEEETAGSFVGANIQGQCSPCLVQHNVGSPVTFEQDGSMHCQPCYIHKVGLGGRVHPMMGHAQWNPQLHPAGNVYAHEPLRLVIQQADTSSPISNEYPINPPLVEGPSKEVFSHNEFEKMGHNINPELLSVIENNNQKVTSLWNEVRNVESRLGNIESVIEVVEKAVHEIEGKLDQYGRPSNPDYRYVGEYLDSHVTDGFQHNPHHSPVLKQYFIPLHPTSFDGVKEIEHVPSNAGLPWPVNKFLAFLMQELQKEKIMQQAEPGLQLQSNPHVPHVPLPQPDLPYPPKEHDIERLEYELGRMPKTKVGQKTYHPEVEEQSICQCENGGQCNGRSECDCPIRYSGARCERPVPRSPLLDSIIDDMPTDPQRQFHGSRQTGLITLPLVVSEKDDQEPSDQKAVGEVNQARLVNLLTQFFGPEYLQRFAKRQKVSERRYVKYPVEKET